MVSRRSMLPSMVALPISTNGPEHLETSFRYPVPYMPIVRLLDRQRHSEFVPTLHTRAMLEFFQTYMQTMLNDLVSRNEWSPELLGKLNDLACDNTSTVERYVGLPNRINIAILDIIPTKRSTSTFGHAWSSYEECVWFAHLMVNELAIKAIGDSQNADVWLYEYALMLYRWSFRPIPTVMVDRALNYVFHYIADVYSNNRAGHLDPYGNIVFNFQEDDQRIAYLEAAMQRASERAKRRWALVKRFARVVYRAVRVMSLTLAEVRYRPGGAGYEESRGRFRKLVEFEEETKRSQKRRRKEQVMVQIAAMQRKGYGV